MEKNPTTMKIILSRDNSIILLDYLNELIEHAEDYFSLITKNKLVYKIHRFNLKQVHQNLLKIIFTSALKGKTKYTLKINEAERLTLFQTVCYYPMPNGLEFIDFEIKKGLLL